MLKEWFVENKLPFRFKGVSKAVKERMEDLCPGRYAFTPDRDNYEYIYKSEDLINLSGKKFRQKKNHLNQFRMQYSNYEYVPITEDIIHYVVKRQHLGEKHIMKKVSKMNW